MAGRVRRMGTASRLVLTFAFGLVLAFACLILVFLAGLLVTLLVLIPGLLLLIYVLPGHGEAAPSGELRLCWRCGRRVARVPGTDSWRCTACGTVQNPGP